MAFASAEFEADGVPARSLAVLSGAMDAVERILREHLRPGDGVAIEDPSFPGLMDLVAASGYVAVPFDVDEEGPRSDATARGAAPPVRRRHRDAARAEPDGCGGDRRARGRVETRAARVPRRRADRKRLCGAGGRRKFHSLRPGTHSRWAVVRSTSKFLGPDLRVALLAGDDLTVSRVRARQALGARWVSHILQQLTLALWSDPSSGRQLARASEIYSQRRAAALAALREHGIDARAASGFNIWIPVRDEVNVVQALAARGLGGRRRRALPDPGRTRHPGHHLDAAACGGRAIRR